VKTNVSIAILVVIGLLGHWSAYRERPTGAICGTDFPIFYAGAKLAASPDLYSPQAVQQIERQEIGCATISSAFIRLPYFAAMLRPLTGLPVRTAFGLWRAAALGAVIAFIVMFRARWKWALLACIWSNALAWDLDNGQDIAFLLLFVAASVALFDRKRHFAAGLCLSLCAAKFHLFVLLPLLLVRRDLRRTSAGVLTGGAVLLAVSFAVGGWDWPSRYLKAISNPLIDPAPLALPNLRGLVRGSWSWEFLLGLTVVFAVWCVCRRANFGLGLSAVIAGSLLVSHHLTASDWALFIPAALIMTEQSSPFASALAVLLITPLVTRLNQPALAVATLLMLVYVLAYEALRPVLAEGDVAVLKASPAA
jgi:Glycosyltransferase family 87